jgi:serine/threonine protein kinase
VPHSIRPGEVLAGRYRLVDLLTESEGGLFWRAHDRVLERHVALHVIDAEDERAPGLLEAARRSAMVLDQRILRVLDAETRDGLCYVVNEWGSGISLDILVAGSGPLGPRRSAWLVGEVADSIARAHAAGVAHGRLNPENVLIDRAGEIRIIGFCVEAALHGLPPDREQIDVIDLAGLLYCALTTKWAGASGSSVAPAPTHHGRVLQPRRVRAGVPRPLDVLCDDVLHRHAPTNSHADVTTARGIATYLAEFVGDPTGMQSALLASVPKLRPDELVVLPQVPEIPVRDTSDLIPQVPAEEPEEPAEREEEEEEEPEPEATPRPPEDLPTEAGMPIFGDDEDEVEWFQARKTPPPPPPPFEEPPERPLFAPEPEDGRPVRRSRVPATSAAGGKPPHGPEYWPWENSTGRGTGNLPAITDEEVVPGRNWFRLALGIAAGVVLLLAVVVAFNLGRGKTVLGQEPEDDEPTRSPQTEQATPSAEPLTGLTAIDFDPQGDPPEEDPEGAPLAVDGDPATAWTTSSYNEQFGPLGLKTGVGLVIDLSDTRDVSSVDLTLGGAPTDVSLYVTEDPPTGVADLTPVASETADSEELEVALERPATGRYVVVWLTSLPPSDGKFRGSVAEVVVNGA